MNAERAMRITQFVPPTQEKDGWFYLESYACYRGLHIVKSGHFPMPEDRSTRSVEYAVDSAKKQLVELMVSMFLDIDEDMQEGMKRRGW